MSDATATAETPQNEDKAAETVKPLEDYGMMLQAAVLKVNSVAEQHNAEVTFLKTKSGDKVDAVKAIAEESDHAEIAKKRERIAKLEAALKAANDEIIELAEIEYTNNPKYQPLTPELVTEKQALIDQLRKNWTKGRDAIEFLAPMEDYTASQVEQLIKDHVVPLNRNARKSHATSSDGVKSIRPRIQNLHVNGTHVKDADGKENLTILGKHLKTFDLKYNSGDIANALLDLYKVSDWDGIPDNVSWKIMTPTTDDAEHHVLVTFDKA